MESEQDLRDTMKAYPNELNKYIHQEARDKLMKMGALKKPKEDNSGKEELVKPKEDSQRLEYNDEFKRLKDLSMRELRNIARSKGLSSYSSLREDDLIKLILSKK